MIAERLADLKAKLKARQGQPGFKANAAAIQRQIDELENPAPRYRGKSGRFVKIGHLIANPETTRRVES